MARVSINLKINAALVAFAAAFLLLYWSPDGGAESCIECHLHNSIVEDFVVLGWDEVETLAGLHGREFTGNEAGSSCRTCHEDRQNVGKLPDPAVCLQCHTKGKTSQGEPEMVFHAEEDHWYMEKASCIECHKGHVEGDPKIKFLTTDVVKVCQRCHEKSFDFTKTN